MGSTQILYFEPVVYFNEFMSRSERENFPSACFSPERRRGGIWRGLSKRSAEDRERAHRTRTELGCCAYPQGRWHCRLHGGRRIRRS